MPPKKEELPEIDDITVGSLYSRVDLLKAFTEYFNDALPQVGYEEDHSWTNARILLCSICCGFGCYAQFCTKFPKDRSTIIMCVIGYFTFHCIMAAMDYFLIGSALMRIKIGQDSVCVDVTIPGFTDELTLALRSGTKTVSEKCSAARYFDTDGILCQENLMADFSALVKKYETETKGKKDQ